MNQVNPHNNPSIQNGLQEDVGEEEDSSGIGMTDGVIEVEEGEKDIKDNTKVDGNTVDGISDIYFLEENI